MKMASNAEGKKRRDLRGTAPAVNRGLQLKMISCFDSGDSSRALKYTEPNPGLFLVLPCLCDPLSDK